MTAGTRAVVAFVLVFVAAGFGSEGRLDLAFLCLLVVAALVLPGPPPDRPKRA